MTLKSCPIQILLLFILSQLINSCTGTKALQAQFEKSSCAQLETFNYSVEELPKPLYKIETDSALSARFSYSSLNVANAIGILDLLTDYVNKLKQQHREQSIETRLAILEIEQKITQRINLASLSVSSVTSELDCEEEKMAQIADYLKGKEDETETKLTVTAIAAGALGAIASEVLLSSGNANDNLDVIGVATGITEAALGVMILLNKRKIELFHSRNVLQEIWEGRKTSQIFPSFVWYYLNNPNSADPEKKSLRQQIIERWISFKQIENSNSKKKDQLINLYFGEGGKYSTDQLYNRANMYDQLESFIKLIKQDLTLLAVELEKIN